MTNRFCAAMHVAHVMADSWLRRVLLVGVTASLLTTSAFAQNACPPACGGQTLTRPNFSHANLAGANFDGATIIGGVFVKANLTGAHFDNTTFRGVPNSPAQVNDFTDATLTNATFVGAKFLAPTYFNYATLTCADFSQTILDNGNAVFGDERLLYSQSASCPAGFQQGAKMKFEGATMNCEFIDDWRAFDLTDADVSACLAHLAGRDFTGAVMLGVKLDGAILDGATFTGANLQKAQLTQASLQCAAKCVDFSTAQLQGAKLDYANLTGASLYKAFLSDDTAGKIENAASLKFAHLKNVNLSFAHLSGVTLTSANFYGSFAATDGGCKTTGNKAGDDHAGFTINCASAHKTNMDGTRFENAYLYGVDFTGAIMSGVDFSNAILIGADFAGASITASNGAPTLFVGAYLQGTHLATTPLSNVDLTNAFVDFGGQNNEVYIDLGTQHNQFACSKDGPCAPPSDQDVCVKVSYPNATQLAADNGTMTCPDGKLGPCGTPEPGTKVMCPDDMPGGCSMANPGDCNMRWNSTLTIGTPVQGGPAPGWYEFDATYACAAPATVICSGKGSGVAIKPW